MFTVKKIDSYKDVHFEYASTKVYLGMYDIEERKMLAEVLLRTVSDLVFNDFESDDLYLSFLKESV